MAAPRKKPAKSKPAADPPPAPGHHAPPRKSAAKPLVGVVVKTAVAVSVIVGVVYLIVRAGESAGQKVAPRDRYTVAFTDLQVEPPPGLDRVTFLSEDKHLGRAPATECNRREGRTFPHHQPAVTSRGPLCGPNRHDPLRWLTGT